MQQPSLGFIGRAAGSGQDFVFNRTSIRGKIAAGYALSFVFLLFVASVLFVNLLVVEDWVGFYARVSRFFDTTLEMRRYEKNFLLYGLPQDLDAAVRYADTASALVVSIDNGAGTRWYRGWLAALAGTRSTSQVDELPERTGRLLEEYRALLAEAGRRQGEPPTEAAALLDAAIRQRGRGITEIAEQLSAVEGEFAQTMLRAGRRALVFLVALFLLGTAVMARVVFQTAILPLKDLEQGMQRIAAGEYAPLPEHSGNDELDSMHTAFNRMIKELVEHRHEMLQSERLASLGTMLAGIAHELNNPLSNISTSAELLKEEHQASSVAERDELIGQIISQTDRATDIIRTVLDYSRERAFERRSTNLRSAVSGSLILVRGRLPADVAVELDVAPALEVLADKTKLEQAFINLMANSIDAMSDSGRARTLTVAARALGGEVEVRFTDTGVGIAPHLLDRVFDPFFSTKDAGRGTGLGLYVTHQIVEQHHGSIKVESSEGRGTTVTLRLPAPTLPAPPPTDAPGPGTS